MTMEVHNRSDIPINDSSWEDYDETISFLSGENGEPSHASVKLLVSFAVALVILLVVGVVGNIVAIFSILRSGQKSTPIHSPTRRRSGPGRPWQHLTVTNSYIISLSAADLLFLLFCAPFQGTVYILNHWPYGWLICKLAHFCQYCTVYASVWILTAMSIDRYTAIGFPLKTVKWRRSRRAAKVSGAIWLAAAMASTPWLFLYESADVLTTTGSTVTACYDGWSEELYHYRKWLLLFVACIGFLIPALIIFVMAILIARSIRSTFSEPLLTETRKHPSLSTADSDASASMLSQKRATRVPERTNSAVFKRRRRACWLVFALALIFFVFQGPQNVSLLWINFDSSAVDWILENSEAFFSLRLLAHMLTYVNSVLNPILYGLASGRIRNFLLGSNKQADKQNRQKVIPAEPKDAQRLEVRRGKKKCSVNEAVCTRYPIASADVKVEFASKGNVFVWRSIAKFSVQETTSTLSAAGEVLNECDMRRTAMKRATMRRMSSTVSAFV